MVAKINKGSSLYGAFEYNQQKVDAGEASVILSQGFIHNRDNFYSVSDCIKSIEPYLIANNKTEKPVVHISLNPDPRDVIDDDHAGRIAEEYLEMMGYGNQPYMVYKHEDIERTHYHIVTICVDENGRKINGNYEKRRSVKTCRELELKHGLHIPSKKEQRELSMPKKIEYKKGNLKAQVKSAVALLLSSYKIRNMNDFKTLLELQGVTVTEVNGKIEDKIIRGLFYSAINEKGQKQGRQLKSSLFGKEFGYEGVMNKFQKDNKAGFTTGDSEFIKKMFVQCMYQCKTRTRNELTELLKKRGVDLILRDTKDGRLYGVTIVDHNTKQVIKGSNLGQEFSANNLKNFLDNPHYIIPFPLENKGIETNKNEEFPTKEKGEFIQNNGSLVANGMDFDADEEAYKKTLRKKGKKQHKL